MFRLTIKTTENLQAVNLTPNLHDVLYKQEIEDGLCTIFIAHTTAGITTGEFGEGTEEDLMEVMQKVIPHIRFRHQHDPSHAWEHMAASLIGASLVIPFVNKRLVLGTWQSILLLEFSGPRERIIFVSIQG